MKRFLATSLQGYQWQWLRPDFMAALVVAAIAIPQSLGYAVIVGLPVQTGLYCALLAPIVFALFASSKRLIVGADSATAVLVAAGAASVAVAGTTEYAGAVAVLGLLTAAILVVMAAARLGFLADLISQPVLIGFLAGVGVQLVGTKLPEMLGMHASGNLFEKLSFAATSLNEAHLLTALVAAATLATIYLGAKVRWPGALLALILGIVGTKLFSLQQHGVEVIGSVPAGLPGFSWPELSLDLFASLFLPALAIAIVILTQSLAIIRSSAARHDEKVRDNQDLMSLGLSNAASAVTSGFAINGSPPRTSASEMAGGRSQLVNVFMAVIIGLVLLFATGLFAYMPVAVLAGIVCSIGLHLIRWRELRNIFVMRRSEFAIALVALAGVAFLGVQNGIMIAVAIALLERLHRQYKPSDEVLLRDQIFASWASDRLGTDKKLISAPAGLLVYRFNDALFFENAGYFLNRTNQAIKAAKDPVQAFVLDAGAISDIDYTAAQTLKQLYSQLDDDDIQFGLAHVTPKIHTLLKRYGLDDLIGKEHIYPSVRKAIQDYTKAHISSQDRLHALRLDTKEYVVISGAAMEFMGLRETNDLDLVVSKATYNHLRNEQWKEFVLDDGKRILSRPGYKIMMQWMGYDLRRLQKNAQYIHDIPVMGVADLLDCKTRMGRIKDREDIKRIKQLSSK